MLRSIELFSGAGGLAMGMALAGIRHEALIEQDKWACDTMLENQKSGFPLVAGWPIKRGDVRSYDYAGIKPTIDIVAGGPPCQPFSVGGKHRAHDDPRDMFSTTVDVIRQLRPKAFVVENVKGLTRASFANYFQYIQLQLEYPEILLTDDMDWQGHLALLEREATSGRRYGLTYDVVTRVLNAADYGVPQKRERVFIIGFRHDLEIEWSFPEATHSHDSLLDDLWVSGEYWDHHKIAKKDRASLPMRQKRRIELLRSRNFQTDKAMLPWRTVRDAISDLPNPINLEGKTKYHNHRFQDGARSYKGHTGSPLDLPAKTLKAGDHGVPGGENMLVRSDGSVRYFTARESARLQTFPDGYILNGSWSEIMRQLGNAVPVELARVVAGSVSEALLLHREREILRNLHARNAA